MHDVKKCTSARADGQPCKAKALPGEAVCWAHHPGMAERRREGQRRGGQMKGNLRRAARQWAAAGQVIENDDLPAMLRAAMLDLRIGRIEPAVATALATLAKASVAITVDIDLEKRIEALEADAASRHLSQPFRRVI